MSYSDYLDTNYSACGMEDYLADKRDQVLAEKYYDVGFTLFQVGDRDEAYKYYEKALKFGRRVGLDDEDLPRYS